MNVKNTFINFTPDTKQASPFMRQSTEPVPTIPRAWDTPSNAATPGAFQDPQREAIVECSEDGSDLELEPDAFVPQVTEYEFGLRPQFAPALAPSLYSFLSTPAPSQVTPGIMPMFIPTSVHGAPPQAVAGMGGPPPEWADKSSVMLRNLPCDYTQQTLLAEVDQSGFAGTYDFFYLPIDKNTGGNKGYAFIDFSEAALAWRFKLAYDGRTMTQFNSDKLVSVMPAALQGFEANYAHYANSRVMRGDPCCRPVFFRAPSPANGPLETFGRASPPGALAALTGKPGIRRKGPGRLEQRVELQRREELIQQAVQQLASSVVQQQAEQRACQGEGIAACAPAQQLGAAGEGVQRHFCSSCGSKVKPGFQFCPNCGASLTS